MNRANQFAKLTELISEVENINGATCVLYWDQNTYMPAQGVAGRGRQIATLGKIAHEKMTSSEVGRLLDDLTQYEEELPYSSFESSFLRCVRRNYNRSLKIPGQFISDMLTHQSVCYDAWIKAKEENNFKLVQPLLEKTLEYSKKYADFFEYKHIADPLIEDSDFGFTTETVQKIFSDLRQELVPFVKGVLLNKTPDDSCLRKNYPISLQEQFSKKIIEKLGYDFNRGRLDTTHHPFMITFSHGDVRITTRYQENFLTESIFSTIHETGHAFYEMGCDVSLDGTPLFGGTSSGVHESQSRLWENIVGRSYAFWEYFYPFLQSEFPEQLNSVSLKEFYLAINKVSANLIRTDADELTYNLHVMIRFQLELEMLEGKLKVKDLPEAWNAYYLKDLGLKVPSDSLGCLQDTHWYGSLIGGQFQGYTLGNIMSAQFYEAAEKAIPNLSSQFKEGHFSPLKNWLEQNLHKYGKKFKGLEVLKRATQKDLTIEPYMNYLRKKFPIK
ncbi:carboxypeptidase M32 [Silvanigrella aquatica]|nr:carboxypeptidase M32 [Silvanigrella aquatica]